MAAGRPKTPIAVRIAEGTLRKDRHGDPELQPPVPEMSELPNPPGDFEQAARDCWNRNCQMLLDANLLTLADLDEFISY